MSGIKDKYSIDAKKLYPFLSKSSFRVYLLDIGVFFWGNTWIETFFIKFEVNIEYIRGEAENISILTENLMKKVEIQVFSQTETTKTRNEISKRRLWKIET